MLSLSNFLTVFSDTLTGHLVLVVYLLTVTDERTVWKRLKKLPPLLLSPLIAATIALSLISTIPEFGILRYSIGSLAIFAMCTLWVMWAWWLDFWRAFSSICMAGILQVATSALMQILFLLFPDDWGRNLTAPTVIVGALLLSTVAAAILLKRLHFGTWFRLLLEDDSNLHRTTLLLFALEVAMEAFLILQTGIQGEYLAAYYVLVIALVALMVGLVVYLAHRFEDSRALQVQQDVIAQQQLYEQNLEDIRREVRSFRHDYKNLLAGLSQQAGEGELDSLRSTLSELDADFDRHLGEKIQLSIQIGNLQLPQVRSLLLSKLTDMGRKGVECNLEVLYPVETVGMDVWDFVRCLGILLDNATEAALETEQPWVEIVLLAQSGQLFLRVSNPYTNVLAPEKMWSEGWTTKGTSRGLGLSGYQRILERYPNAVCSTTWEGGVFVQELTVEGRP